MRRDTDSSPAAHELLRYRVVSAVQALMLGGLKRSAAISAVAEQLHPGHQGGAYKFSRRTVVRWVKAFDEEGLDGLRDTPRTRCDSSIVLTPELLAYLEAQKSKDPRASIPELLRRARLKGVLHPTAKVDRATVWRALKRMGVSTRRLRRVEVDDKRRFAFPHRLQMVLIDFKHFRVGPTRARRVAIYFLDDATRYGLGVLVGTPGEKPIYCLRGLAEVFRRFGRMQVIFFDHGPAFTAEDVLSVLRGLLIHAIHGRPEYPEGHGKIERFNQSVKARTLRSLDGAPDVDADPASLTLRLRHDLFEIYNHLPHESLGGDTPHSRWVASTQPLQPFDDEAALTEAFVIEERRTVSNDHCISFSGMVYEVPMGLAGQRIAILRALLEDDALYLDHRGRRVRLHPVDLALNAQSSRARGQVGEEDPDGPPVKSASALAFEREYGPLLSPDGGFPDGDAVDSITPEEEEEDE